MPINYYVAKLKFLSCIGPHNKNFNKNIQSFSFQLKIKPQI
jgi:hypothetical protein